MSTIIKADLTNDIAITMKTRRIFKTMEINADDEYIKVFYTEEKFYVDNSVDIITSSEVKSYLADFAAWKVDAVGVAITSALETELAKAVPGSV